MVRFDEIEEAFSFVNSVPYGEHKAWLCLENGEILWFSEFLDAEEQGNVENRLEHGKWIEIPHKNDLGAGKRIVFQFAEENLSPEDFHKVERCFSHQGAYGNFKNLLHMHGLLEAWYEFSDRKETEALKQWLANEEIPYE